MTDTKKEKDSSHMTDCTENAKETQKEISKVSPIHNAIRIVPAKGVKFSTKMREILKNKLGMIWDNARSGWFCPISSQSEIVNLFKVKGIDCKITSCHNPIVDKTKGQKKVENLETTKYGLEKDLCDLQAELSCDIEKFDKSLHPIDFVDPPKEDGKTETELLFHNSFHQKQKEIKALQINIKNLTATIEQMLEDDEPPENIDLVLKSLDRNESGDAELWVEMFKHKYIFDPRENKGGEWYIYNGCKWELDLERQRLIDMDTVCDVYADLSRYHSTQSKKAFENGSIVDGENSCESLAAMGEALQKRSTQLRTKQRKFNALIMSAARLPLRDKWDDAAGKLPCKNGLLDLRTKEIEKPDSKHYLRKVNDTIYDPKATCPKFLRFLDEVTLGDKELASFLCRVFGYAVIGIPKEEKIFYFYGSGRNGKGTLVQVLEKVLGSVVSTFPSEMLLQQRNPTSSGSASPDLVNFKGCRVAFFSETTEGKKLDSAKVKNLSGNDTISCRRLFSNIDEQITPTHTMIVQTNYKPKASPDDIALWSRTVLIAFEGHFTSHPTQIHHRLIKEGLKAELLEEAPGILNWIVEGSLEYQKIGLAIPESVKAHTEQYRKENDGIGNFLQDCCEANSQMSTKRGVALEKIQGYCEENGFRKPNRNEINSYLEKKYSSIKTNEGRYWVGLEISDR